jgi:CheY-like chemotaxis protein
MVGSGQQEPEAGAVRRVRVLVVEDNPVNQQVALRTLERMGYAVDLANDGEAGVEAVATGVYALVLMDCRMPGMDGYAATAAIRLRQGAGPRTPVIAMTADATDADRDRCLAAGMDDYVTKPFRYSDLEATLRRWALLTGPATGEDPEVVHGTSGTVALDEAVVEQVRALAGKAGAEVVNRLAALFSADTPERLAALRQAAVDGDGNRLMDVAHSLKGSAASLGAGAMVALCRELEELGRSGRLENVEETVARIELLYPRVAEAVAALAPAVRAAPGASYRAPGP